MYERRLLAGDIDADLFRANALALWNGIEKGYGKNLGKVDFNGKDYEMLKALRENAYTFAAFKNHHNVKEMVDLLMDGSGNIKPFNLFRAEALALNEQYNVNWLQAEYNTALSAGRSASKWQSIQENKKLFPYLEYKTVGDGRVRDDHAQLNGIIRPVDDDFWNTWMPPNSWNCRCTVVPVASGVKVIPDELPPPDKLWNGNPGKTKEAFPKQHPYFKGVSKGDRETVKAAVRSELAKPVSDAFQIVKDDRGINYINEALAAINKVHDDGELPVIPLRSATQKELGKGTLGAFYHSRVTGRPTKIWFNQRAKNELTLAHEIGHFLDHQVLDKRGVFASDTSELLDGWRKAVKKTKAFERLKETYNTRLYRYKDSETVVDISRNKPFLRHLQYLISEKELFARSYAQYITEKSGSKKMLDAVKKTVSHNHVVSASTQWDSEDFAIVLKEFDKLFEKKGWMITQPTN